MTAYYGLVEETYMLGDRRRTSYGIAAYAAPGPDGVAAPIRSVHDICRNPQRLSALVDTCNRLELSPLHLDDVIVDFLES